MSRYVDFYLIGELVDSHGNVHYEDLKNLPTADVVERKHGEWIVYNPKHLHTICSCCGYYNAISPYYKYCPNCGADMRGAEDDK